MRTIRVKLEIDGVDMVTPFTDEEYKCVKEKTGLDPALLAINNMWEEINKHKNLLNTPLVR